MSLPKKQQLQEFNKLRKEGIFLHNKKILQQGKPQEDLEVERRSKISDISAKKLKMCTKCKAFIDAKYFFHHKKTCISTVNEPSSLEVPSGLNADLLHKYDAPDDKEFLDMLNRFNDDEKGRLCKSDDMLICLGRYMHAKNKRRKGKTAESRKVVMQNMRTLAGIYNLHQVS